MWWLWLVPVLCGIALAVLVWHAGRPLRETGNGRGLLDPGWVDAEGFFRPAPAGSHDDLVVRRRDRVREAGDFAEIVGAMPDVAALGRQLLDADLYLLPVAGGDGHA